jgi:regulator of protease activity HflC (stomatin/prohibitin superfamily)
MKNIKLILLAATVCLLSSCSLASVDGGQEGVFIKKPWFFGKGGVDTEALTEGSTWKVISTDFVVYSMVNEKHEELFNDIASDDHTLMDIPAYVTTKIKTGKSPILHMNYGSDWYENNIKEFFSKKIRAFVSTYDMASLIGEREIYDDVEANIKKEMTEYISELSKDREFPIEIVQVFVGKAEPDEQVREELNNTAIKMQQKHTELMKQEMEKERKKTEHLRAEADMEYQRTMNLTAAQFIQLRGLELENQKIEMIKNKPNVNVDVMLGNTTPMWDIKQK